MFTAAQRAAAVSPETALLIEDYPYGFRLRCQMKVWIEFRKGKGFRYVTQTSNPKRPGTWNKPKAGTYSRVSMVIAVNDDGHLHPASLTEYSSLPEYYDFAGDHFDALSPHALASMHYFQSCKEAFEDRKPVLPIIAAHVKAGTEY